jgi:type II secretory pathway component PulF
VERVLDAICPPRRRALAAAQAAVAARMLAGGLQAKVPLPELLRAVAPAVRGRELARRLEAAAARIEGGEPPAAALAPARERDGLFLFHVSGAVSHREGPELLARLADRLGRTAMDEVSRLPAVVVPAITVATGAYALVVLGSIMGVLTSLAAEMAHQLLR